MAERAGPGQGALSPCPNCESELGPFVAKSQYSPLVHQVVCSTCGMHGPYDTIKKTATEKWNDLPRNPPHWGDDDG